MWTDPSPVVTVGAGGAIDTTKLKDPIVGFAVDQKGLMANLTFEGSKFTKLDTRTCILPLNRLGLILGCQVQALLPTARTRLANIDRNS